LAERIKRVGATAFYTSPLRRAVETAQIIGGDSVREDNRLIEIDLELGDDGSFQFTESPASVIERMRSAIDDFVAAHPGEHVVVVTHGVALMAYISEILHLDPSQVRLLPYYTSVSVVRALGDVRRVATIADMSHLE
jgi:broad specificity phosphatase PhoE